MLNLLLSYWKVGVIGIVVAMAAGWCYDRDQRLKAEGRNQVLLERYDSLQNSYEAIEDSLTAQAAKTQILVDTIRVVVPRVQQDTVTVERLATEIREVVPDSVVAKVDSLEAAYDTAQDALVLAAQAIENLTRENQLLRSAQANLRAQIEALQIEDTRPGWLDTGIKVAGGLAVGYVIGTLR